MQQPLRSTDIPRMTPDAYHVQLKTHRIFHGFKNKRGLLTLSAERSSPRNIQPQKLTHKNTRRLQKQFDTALVRSVFQFLSSLLKHRKPRAASHGLVPSSPWKKRKSLCRWF